MPDTPTYPTPPFLEPDQPWPALACRMDPPPGQPAEIAALYVLLASGEASCSTGNGWGSTGGEAGP